MTTKSDRPPLSIKELQKKVAEREEPKQGELTYVNQNKEVNWGNKGKVVGSKSKGQNRILNLVIPIFVSVILAAFMLIQFAPSKNNFIILSSEVGNLSGGLTSIDTQIRGQTLRLDELVTKTNNVINSMGTYSSKAEVEESILGVKGEMSGLRSTLDFMEGRVNLLTPADTTSLSYLVGNLKTRVETLEGSYSTLSSRVRVLEDKVEKLED